VAEVLRTAVRKISWILATENRRTAVLIPLWGLAITAAYSQAIFQRAYMTFLDYGLVFLICLMAGAIAEDMGRALLSYLSAMALGTFLLLILLSTPASATSLPQPGGLLFTSLWVTVIFTAVFPLPFIGYLMATIIGAAIGEKYF
jgi:hypothetical protein